MKTKKKTLTPAHIIQNIIVGLTVSFIALSLGAAFGILSGRGAYAGMISAGIIALITSAFGGTRVQCSGPTAPMSAISAIVVAVAVDRYGADASTHFINIVFMMTGILLIIMGIFRLGRFIKLVPNVVVSGFMSGIAVIIWVGQVEFLFGLNGSGAIDGDILENIIIVLATLIILFGFTPIIKRISHKVSHYMPATLVAIIVVSFFVNFMEIDVEKVNLTSTIHSFDDFKQLMSQQWPASLSYEMILEALPYAIQLAILCYLDTLLTSLVVDRMTKEKTKQNRELAAQGVANSIVVFFGGIPGAQATIRSVLLLKEGATLRLAGIFVGLFVIIEMLLFHDLINYIPQAVFMGVLIKVGYDVFDFRPFILYIGELVKGKISLIENIFARHEEDKVFVTNLEILLVIGTIIVTVVYDLNIAVIGFSAIFYLLNLYTPIRDLTSHQETKAVRGFHNHKHKHHKKRHHKNHH